MILNRYMVKVMQTELYALIGNMHGPWFIFLLIIILSIVNGYSKSNITLMESSSVIKPN